MATTVNIKRETAHTKTKTARGIEDMFDDGEKIKHPILGAIVNIVSSAFGVYAGIQFGAYIGVVAATMSGSTFIGMLLAFIACLLSSLQALRFSAAVGKYVSTGAFEDDYQRAKSWVKGLFGSKEIQHV